MASAPSPYQKDLEPQIRQVLERRAARKQGPAYRSRPDAEVEAALPEGWGIGIQRYDPMVVASLAGAVTPATRLVWLVAPDPVTLAFPDLRGLVRTVRERAAPLRILTGIEVDILADGTLDQEPELLERLDIVVKREMEGERAEVRVSRPPLLVTATREPLSVTAATPLIRDCTSEASASAVAAMGFSHRTGLPAARQASVAPPVYAKRFRTLIPFFSPIVSRSHFQFVSCSGKTPTCLKDPRVVEKEMSPNSVVQKSAMPGVRDRKSVV